MMTESETDGSESHISPVLNDRIWILVPLLAFGGILITLAAPSLTFAVGTGGCVLASILLAYIAYHKPKKDIVSLLSPLYAVLIFFNPSFEPTLLQPIQLLYAGSITLLVFRLNARFSQKDAPPRRFIGQGEEESDNE